MFFGATLHASAQTLNATSINFGNLVVQTTSVAKIVILTNTQSTPLTISGISTSGDFAQTSKCPISPTTLAVGATCQISVTFTPTVYAPESGTLTVNDNGSNSPQTVQLSGTGVLPVSVTPSSYTFGNQAENTSGTARTVEVTNHQMSPLTITSISVTGNFGTTSNCPVSPNTLAARASCTISVAFAPTTLGAQSGTLTVTHNASNSPQTLQLSGVGITPVLLSPATFGFGNQSVGTSSTVKTATLTNDQSVPLTISTIAISGPFSQTSTCPLSPNTLASNTSCTISVVFTPSGAGAATGVLSVVDSASNSPQTATLTGTGLVSIGLTPTSLTFAGIHPPSSTAPETITLKNNQSAALTISSISTTGNFSETSNCPLSPNTLATGAACTISVTFTPTTIGPLTGTLIITDSAGSQTATLSGTGVLTGLVTIALTPAAPAMFTGTQQQITATGTFANGTTFNVTNFVNWSSSAPFYAQVNSTGLVQAISPGVAVVVASYGKSSGISTVKVSAPAVTSLTVTPAKPSQPAGAYQQFSAVLHYSNGTTNDATNTVTWSSSSSTVAPISSSGLATAASAGSVNIQATLGSVKGATTFAVTKPTCTAAPAGLTDWWTGDGNVVDLGGNNSGMLQNGASYSAGEVSQAFNFTGNGSSVLVNSPVYSAAAGTLVFWFNSIGGGALTGSTAGGQNQAPGFLVDTQGNLNWEFGNLGPQSIGQVSPNRWYHAALTYSTSGAQTAISVYLNGVLVDEALVNANTAWSPQVALGAYLGAQQPSFVGSMDEIAVFNQALTGSQILQIYDAYSAGICKPVLQSIAINPVNPNLAPGLTLPMDAVGTYSNTTTHDVTTSATWSVGNTNYATISTGGIATGVSNGSTSVTAALGSIQGSTTLAVKPSLVSIQVNPQNPFTSVGAVQSFTATGTFSDGSQQNLSNAVTWSASPSTPTVAAIGNNGIATSMSSGQTTITATAGAISGTSVLSVTSASLVSIAVTPASPSIVAGSNQQFTAIGTFSDGSQQNLTNSVSWGSASSAIATITSSGLASGVGLGSVTITASQASVSGTANLSVTTAVLTAIQVTPQSSSITVGASQQFTANAIYSNGTSSNVSSSAAWTSSAATVATMSSTTPGLAVSAGTGTATISASFGGLVDSTSLTVQDQLISIAISPATFSLTPGQTEQFAATGTYASGVTQNLTSSATWNSTTSGIAGVSPTGLATALTSGQTNVTATLGAVTGSANLTVGLPSVVGQWTTLSYTAPINPVHVALLNNNEVLAIAGSGNCAPNLPGCPTGPPYGPANNSGAMLLNPNTGQVVSQFNVPFDMFCDGMVLLQDGTAFIAGGNLTYNPFTGEAQAAIFNPTTNAFTTVPNMAHGRWYPTVLTLGDGTVMAFSGLTETGATNATVEFYTEGTGWSTPYTAPFTPDTYPRLHLLPSGNVFYSGSITTSKIFNPTTTTWNTNVAATNYGGVRQYGSSVLLPLSPANNYDPQIMILGGGNPATNTTEIIDMGAATPAWVYGPNMSQARIEMNAIILPTGTVLALGGSVNNEDATTASYNADLYNPATNTFSSAGANAFARLYHSVALLLPNGTVWVAGGNPTEGNYEPHMEVYQPAYLFNSNGTLATQPTITSAPSSASYGSTFSVATPQPANISSVVLIRNGTVTHAFGMDQREVALSFTVSNGSLTVTAPPNGNVAPPGFYMLFLVNSSGVPSVATFIQITSSSSGEVVKASAQAANPSISSGLTYAQVSARNAAVTGSKLGSAQRTASGPIQRITSTAGATSNSQVDLSGMWSGTLTSKDANAEAFTMRVLINKDEHGHFVGSSTLESKCLKDAQLQVTVKGSEIILAGSDEQGDNITVRGTLDKTGSLLKSTYILDGSASGRCETDAGTGTLTRQ